MPLTPEAVDNKEFTTVRLREGYDMQEVDEFLDEVAAELSRMYRENEELREKLGAVTQGGGIASSVETLGGPKPPPSGGAPGAPAVTGAPTEAAAKVLALAQKTADELVADAKLEADRLLADARQRADKIDSESSAKVSKIENDARGRADALEREAQQRHQQVVGKLESEREHLDSQVQNLKAFEREYRSRLKAYLESELRKLETSGVSDGAVAAEPNENAAGSLAASGAATTSGSLRSVASLLDDEQR
jgi:DivIVA domain-containing protein